MPEPDELASAFVELEALVRDHSRLPGLAAARAEARRRRANRAAWMSAALLVLVLGGVATAVPGWLRPDGQPAQEPSPSVTADPTPSGSGTIAPTPSAVLADMTPPERILDATIDVPAVDLAGCPSGRLTFQEGSYGSADTGQLTVEVAAVGDVDADGLEDVVVALRCTVPVGTHGEDRTQILAYSGPELAPLGPLAVGANATVVTSLWVHPDGQVELALAQVTVPRAHVMSIALDRYRWTGSGFESIEQGDVATDDLPVAVISAEPGSLELTPGGPAQRLAVTVRNDGPALAIPFRLDVSVLAPVSVEIEGFAVSGTGPRHSLLLPVPPTGEAVTVGLRIALPAGATLTDNTSIMANVMGMRPADALTYVQVPLRAQ